MVLILPDFGINDINGINGNSYTQKGVTLNYSEFVTTKYMDKMSPAGDLARDIRDDPHFPELEGMDLDAARQTVKTYLKCLGACDGCMAAFKYTWSRYRAAMRQ